MHANYDISNFLVLLNVLNVYFVRGVLYSCLSRFISSFIFKQGFKISLKELDNLLSALQEQKKKLEQKEADTSIQILLNVLYCLRSQKIRDLQEVPPPFWFTFFTSLILVFLIGRFLLFPRQTIDIVFGEIAFYAYHYQVIVLR